MSYMPRNAATTATWDDLVDELDRWEAAGRVVTLWWRDDDAVTTTAALTNLLKLADGVPLGLGVIPAMARPELTAALRGIASVTVLQHGWLHADRGSSGKKTEYPDDRTPERVVAEVGAGQARLRAMFGGQSLPIFVPPWNRIAAGLLPRLVEAGIVGLSGMASLKPAVGVGMPTLHVHVDLTAWRGGRGFVGTGSALNMLIGNLRRMKTGVSEPLGLLTHHLVMDPATAEFIHRLLDVTRAHRAVHWASPAEFAA